jgi:hypothetical protein
MSRASVRPLLAGGDRRSIACSGRAMKLVLACGRGVGPEIMAYRR